jgi:hypothetical protein
MYACASVRARVCVCVCVCVCVRVCVRAPCLCACTASLRLCRQSEQALHLLAEVGVCTALTFWARMRQSHSEASDHVVVEEQAHEDDMLDDDFAAEAPAPVRALSKAKFDVCDISDASDADVDAVNKDVAGDRKRKSAACLPTSIAPGLRDVCIMGILSAIAIF